MRKLSKKWKLWGIFLILMFFAAGATVHTTATDVQAATKNGFKTENGKSYYYKNGKKVKGWLPSMERSIISMLPQVFR